MKKFNSFDLVFEDGLLFTKIMYADTVGANEIGASIAEDWESNNVTFHAHFKPSAFCEVLIFKKTTNLESDFWEGEIRIYHLRGERSYEGFLRACADGNVDILGVAVCSDKNYRIISTPIFSMNLNQIFPYEFDLNNALDDINQFGLDIKNHNFRHETGGILQKLSYIAGVAVASILNDGKLASSFENEIISLVKKSNPQSSRELYFIISEMVKEAFNDNITVDQVCELLLIREDIYSFGKECGGEPGLYDFMYDDLSKAERNKIETRNNKERIAFHESDYGHYINSLRQSLMSVGNKKREINIFLSMNLK